MVLETECTHMQEDIFYAGFLPLNILGKIKVISLCLAKQ